jgi:hypothetical protein
VEFVLSLTREVDESGSCITAQNNPFFTVKLKICEDQGRQGSRSIS